MESITTELTWLVPTMPVASIPFPLPKLPRPKDPTPGRRFEVREPMWTASNCLHRSQVDGGDKATQPTSLSQGLPPSLGLLHDSVTGSIRQLW
jgi:hypothetical protein